MWKSIAAALAFAAAAWFALNQTLWSPAGNGASPLGDIAEIRGEVSARPPEGAIEERVVSSRKLGARETLATGPGSAATLAFARGAKIKVLENSKVVAEPAGSGQVHVTVLTGSVEIADEGAAESVLVFKDGQRFTGAAAGTGGTAPVIVSNPIPPTGSPAAAPALAEEAVLAPTTPDETAATPAPTPPRALPAKSAERAKTLSDDEINRVLAAQGSRFQRCFLDFMKRRGTTDMRGTVSVAFVIATNGKVENQRIVGSPFSDPLLHNCVAEVIDRAPFPGFEGEAIDVTGYPIRFE